MRNDLEYYRKFSIPDYCLNAKKFREYCEFCKKTENLSEKKRIIENLVNYANTVSISNTSKKKEIIDNIVNLCSNAILNSDLEIEILFEIENFSINFQKQILIGVITLSYDKTKEISNYNQIKYHLWIIKSQNLLLKEGKTLEIPSDEVAISIQTLEKEMNDIKLRFNDSQTQVNMKILILKVAYELGYYYFLYKNYSKSIDYYGFLLDNYFPSNLLYFNIEKVNSVMNRLKNYGNISKTVNSSSNSDMKIDYIKSNESISNSLPNAKFNFLDIVNLHKLLETSQISFDEYSTNIITYYKINELSYLELVNTNEILSLCRKSIYNTLLYPSKLLLFKEILKKINQINSQRQIKVSEKEISYYTLIQLCFELENNINEDKMKEVLKEVSSTIMKYDIPSDKDSLVILNLILINYTEYIYLTCKFLSDLTQYLNKKSLDESVEIIYIRDLSSCLQLFKSNMEINLTYNQSNNLCGMLFGLSYILKSRNYDFFNLILISIKNIEINLLLHRILLIYVTELINIINQNEERKENEDDLILELCEENNQFVSLYNDLYDTVLNEVGICNKPKVVYDDKSYSNNHYIDEKNNIHELYKSLYFLYTFILNIESNIHKSIIAFQMKSTDDAEENILLIRRKIVLNSIIQKISRLTKNNVCEDENKGRRGQIIQSSTAIYFNYKLSLKFNSLFTSLGTNQIDENEYNKFKELVLFDSCIKYYIDSLIEDKRILEYLFLSQYKIYKYHSLSNRYQPKNILQLLENSKIENHNEVILELFFSVPYLEALSCYYMERGYKDKVGIVSFQMKRVSIHQFNVKTDYRRGFKVYNFMKFLEIQKKGI